jgi:hypothetical protein
MFLIGYALCRVERLSNQPILVKTNIGKNSREENPGI